MGDVASVQATTVILYMINSFFPEGEILHVTGCHTHLRRDKGVGDGNKRGYYDFILNAKFTRFPLPIPRL